MYNFSAKSTIGVLYLFRQFFYAKKYGLFPHSLLLRGQDSFTSMKSLIAKIQSEDLPAMSRDTLAFRMHMLTVSVRSPGNWRVTCHSRRNPCPRDDSRARRGSTYTN